MMTHRERLLKIARGEMVDKIPFIPRIDLWHNAHQLAGTLPEKYKGLSVEEIHRVEGWPLHKMIPEYLKPERAEDNIHRAIGLYRLKEFPYDFEFSSDVEINIKQKEGGGEYMTHVEYHTPQGMVSVSHGYTKEMKKSGASITWVQEPAIKGREDYKSLAHLFGNLKLKPAYERFAKWKKEVGEDGIAVGQGLGIACTSPMHFIQKTLIRATEFYLHYHDFYKEMRNLAEALESTYNQLVGILADSPCDAVLWSANVDDMITYPALYEKDFLPWCHKAADRLSPKGILLVTHTDGENKGLMDLIANSRMDIADAVTPYPMTKVKVDEYYDRWCRTDKLTIHGGIPEMFLLKESTTREDLEDYLDHLFEVIIPGKRFIASIGDTTPAGADFDRLLLIADRFEEEGSLPLKGSAFRPVREDQLKAAAKVVAPERVGSERFKAVHEDVLEGNNVDIKFHVQDLLNKGFGAKEILDRGMLSAMEVISGRFRDGTVFIPEVLLSARAMNEALAVLEPYLAGEKREAGGKILIGTVQGDLHDIGKNMVFTMLRGVGFDVVDLGINVSKEEFVRKVEEYKPHILGMSALLTTSMAEMKKVIDALVAAGLRQEVKVIVGGAPVNEKFARDIGADGYGADAGSSVDLARQLMRG
ncbi:MAG: corrinoid protein [Deltaproteobacteria bacterium]|nr:corrinoid protein [Deltaproteobacteria bacterium]